MSETLNTVMSANQPDSSVTPSADITSVLTQIKTQQELLKEKEQRIEELEKLNSQFLVQSRAKMQEKFNSDIHTWIKSWPDNQFDNDCKKDILEKAQNMANKGVENGVWKLLCCASSIHNNQVNEINKLTEEYNRLKDKVDGGEFKNEESRKRKEPEFSPPDTWAQLETMCKNY